MILYLHFVNSVLDGNSNRLLIIIKLAVLFSLALFVAAFNFVFLVPP